MAQYLIRAQDNQSSSELKGDIVEVRADDTPVGSNANFIIVKIPGVVLSQADIHSGNYRANIDYIVQTYDNVNDIYRIRVFNPEASTSGMGNLTLVHIQRFLDDWGAILVSQATNEVIFDFSVFNAGSSSKFWGYNITQITFTNVSYNNTTGLHRIQADYNTGGWNPTSIERQIMKEGATIISHGSKVIVFDLPKTVVLEEFKRRAKQGMHGLLVKKRKHYITNAAVNNVIAQGGVATSTWAQFLTYVRDKVND